MKFSRKFFVEAGKRGGTATLAKHGIDHFKNIPRLKSKKVNNLKNVANKPQNEIV
jgi:hypothetical protein